MSKRFREIVSIETIKDTETGEKYIGIVDSAFIDLVNALHEENQQFRRALQKHYHLTKDYHVAMILEALANELGVVLE